MAAGLRILGIIVGLLILVVVIITLPKLLTPAPDYAEATLLLCDKLDGKPSNTFLPSGTRLLPVNVVTRQRDDQVFDALPPDRRANNQAQVGGVICIRESKVNAESITYYSVKTGEAKAGCVREVYVSDLYFIDPKTGELMYYEQLHGGPPPGCANRLKDTTYTAGSQVTAQEIAAKVAEIVPPLGVVIVRREQPTAPVVVEPTSVPTAGSVVEAAPIQSDPVVKILTLQGHKGDVNFVAFSPNGSQLASASTDKSVAIWDVKSGNLLTTLQGHKNAVLSVAFSPNGNLLASASADRTVRIWDVKSGNLLTTLQGHKNAVLSVAFSPNGNLLASASADGTVRIWDVKSRKLVITNTEHTDQVLSVAFSPDGSLLVAGGKDKTIRVWGVNSWKQRLVLKGHTDQVSSIVFSTDGSYLASSGPDKSIRIWRMPAGQVETVLTGHESLVTSISFNAKNVLATGSADKTIRLWSVKSGTQTQLIGPADDIVLSVAFSPDGAMLAYGSHDQKIQLVRITTLQ